MSEFAVKAVVFLIIAGLIIGAIIIISGDMTLSNLFMDVFYHG